MGLQEMCLILLIIISIGQYLVAWGAYVEKKLTLVCVHSIVISRICSHGKRKCLINDYQILI